MTNGMLHGVLAAALAISISTVAGSAVAADAAGGAKGDSWETTSQMVVPGMPAQMQMPASKLTVCSAKEWRQPPGASNNQRNCQNSPMKTVGNKVTWTVQCTGPTMTGVGEITRGGADSYTGFIKFTSEQGDMTLNLTGHKAGECDHPQ
jgi:hypothetical protein